MKFMHIADCHLGGWRHPVLREISHHHFSTIIDIAVTERVDFLLIAGDFFNTSFPSIETLQFAAEQLSRLKTAGIPIYLIPGSHDYSPSGRTILDVFDHAGLFVNIMRRAQIINDKIKLPWIRDPTTGACISGMFGRRGGLDKNLYPMLDREALEQQDGYTIFMFHCAITDLQQQGMAGLEAVPLSLFPKHRSYYAGGHVHVRRLDQLPEYPQIVYPGPVFPNNFSELEELQGGSYVIVDNGVASIRTIALHEIICCSLDITGLDISSIEANLRLHVQGKNIADAIVLVRLRGMTTCKASDLTLGHLVQEWMAQQKARIVLKNTAGIQFAESGKVRLETGTLDDIEERMVQELFGNDDASQGTRRFVHDLTRGWSDETKEGETQTDYETRMQTVAATLISQARSSGVVLSTTVTTRH